MKVEVSVVVDGLPNCSDDKVIRVIGKWLCLYSGKHLGVADVDVERIRLGHAVTDMQRCSSQF